MKLKELVANSLPRVRGKKKKSPALVNCPVPSPSGHAPCGPTSGSAACTSEPGQHLSLVSPACAVMAAASYTKSDDDFRVSQLSFGPGLERGESRASFSTFFPTGGQAQRPGVEELQPSGLTWHGNALYRGLSANGAWETATEKVFSAEMVSSSKLHRGRHNVPLPYKGMTTSHSAEGISAHHLLMMSRSGYDARMAVSEYGGSCSSQMSVISESAIEAYSTSLRQRQGHNQPGQQQHPNQHQVTNLNAHYHQHNHQHFHHYHHHHHLVPNRAMPLAQQPPPGQRLHPTVTAAGNGLPTYAIPHATPQLKPNQSATQLQHQQQAQAQERNSKKQELGFFRKSFASLKSMRKHSSSHNDNNNTLVSPTPVKSACVAPLTKANLAASEHLRCSVCPYPDKGGVTSANATACCGDKPGTRPSKPKRRGFKGLSKSKSKKVNPTGKENKDSGDASSCFSDNDAQSMVVAVGQPITDCPAPGFYPTWDRSRRRECSVESFSSSRVCGGSREGSCYRELDVSGCFDTASLSGYESDFHRGAKAHNRSRSRIRTNPWLPSPQPSLGMNGGCRRGEGAAGWKDDGAQLRESQEDMALGEEFDRNLQGAGSSARAIARSASFEHRRPATLKSLATSYHPGCQNFSSLSARAEQTERGDKLTAWMGESRQQDKLVSCEKTKQRPLTPSVDPDDLSTMSLDRPHKTTPPAVPKKPSWWNFGRRNSKKEAGVKVALDSTQSSISSSSFGQSSAKQSLTSVSCSSSSPTDSTACKSPKRVFSPASHDANNSISSQGTRQALNDLNMDTTQHVIKSRPCSIVSPNSEFVLLAGHLEQLANNISFEYEDSPNSTASSSHPGNCSSTLVDTNTSQNTAMAQESNATSTASGIGNGTETGLASSLHKNISGNRCLKGDNLNLQTPESPFSTTSGCSLTSPSLMNAAHSPDSGVGGLGSTDGDDSMSSSNAVKTPGSPHCDRTVSSSDPDFDSIIDDQYVYPHCDKSGCSFSCYACDNRQQKMFASKIEDRLLTKTNSFSSGPDDDSSATISESDVDNTHYHDDHTTPSFLLSNAGNNSPSKNNYHNLKMNLDRSSGQRQRICMGSRASAHLLETKSPQSDCEASNTVPSKHRQVACRPRELKTSETPIDFKTGENQHFGGDPSGVSLSRKERSLNNTTTLEDEDSPTNSSPSVPSRMTRTCRLDAAMILEANLRRVKAPSVEDCTSIDDSESVGFQDKKHDIFKHMPCHKFGVPQSVANKDGEDDRRSHTTVDMASLCGDVACMDCSVGSRGEDHNFDMSDACVQTDFDEEFPRWDDIGVLDSLDQSALDPAESTRRWLLTGNMQGSADTGYASQPRESQIYMDDDTLHLSGDLSAETFRSWLSNTDDRLSTHSSEERTPRNSASFDNYPDFTMDQSSSSVGLSASLEEGPIIYKPISSEAHVNRVCYASTKKAPAVVPRPKQVNPDVVLRSDRTSTRSISPSSVDQMFSGIEHQFLEIFQQRHGSHRYTCSSPNPKRFSDSSDSTLASEGSGDSSYSGGAPVGELHDVAARCREANINSRASHSQLNALPDNESSVGESTGYANTSNTAPCGTKESSRQTSSQKAPAVAKKPTFSSRSHSKDTGQMSTVDLEDDRRQGCPEKACIRREEVRYSPKSDSADYLEFLRDAPLDRANLKRPLFLVPGVGPVDISREETVNMFSEEPSQHLEKEVGFSSGDQKYSAQGSSVDRTAKKMKSNGKTQKAVSSKKRDAHAHVEGNGSKRISPTSAPYSSTFQKSHHSHPPTTVSVQSPHQGHMQKNRVSSANGGLSFENKSYQSPRGIKDFPLDQKDVQAALLDSKAKSKEANMDESQLISYSTSDMDEETRLLAERVMALRHERDAVYQKLQAAQLEELTRSGNLKELRKHAQSSQKDTLLRTLRELRDNLEEQKRLLQQKGGMFKGEQSGSKS